MTNSYSTAEALRQSITERAKHAARVDPSTSTDKRMRQFAYSRFLARVFSASNHDWVLKGGVALLARLTDARHSRDIDLARKGQSITDVFVELEELVQHDIGDFFEFRLQQPIRELTGRHTGFTVAVIAYLGIKEFARFNVDVVLSANTTAEPDVITPALDIEIPGIAQVQWRAYPLVDHIADKFAAIAETHGGNALGSNRYRDLVDIVLIATSQQIASSSLRIAIASEFQFRDLTIRPFEVPDLTAWRDGYNAIAKELPNLKVTFNDACLIASDFFSGVNQDETTTWDPGRREWV